MPTGCYTVTRPIMALFHDKGRLAAHKIPSGAIIRVEDIPLNKNLLNVIWDGINALVFTKDFRSRTKSAREDSG